MTAPTAQQRLVRDVRQALVEDAGYHPESVREDYPYADYVAEHPTLRRASLAAFAGGSPSYRTVRVLLQFVDDVTAVNAPPSELLALGAPRIALVGPTLASVWTQRGEQAAICEHDRVEAARLARLIRTNPAQWSSEGVLRAARIGPVDEYQLEFADVGLLPVIEQRVNEKLDRLIRTVLDTCLRADPSLGEKGRFPALARYVLALLTAKVLIDRGHPSVNAQPADASAALRLASAHVGIATRQDNWITRHGDLLAEAWSLILDGFRFENVSVDALAFVYENTLVDEGVRRKLGVHGTPRAVAELVVRRLPLHLLEPGRDRIVELCAGYGPFLVAALDALARLLPPGVTAGDRHQHLVKRLVGAELDAFAIEVCRLSLTLADYPNHDGWQLHRRDVFADGALQPLLAAAGAVLANPPFERFSGTERERYEPTLSEKAGELLHRVLEVSNPQMIGFVLPRAVLKGNLRSARNLQQSIASRFREIETIDLPDSVFRHSDAETVLLIAHDDRANGRRCRRHARVPRSRSAEFLAGRWRPAIDRVNEVSNGDVDSVFEVAYELEQVWAELGGKPTLGANARVHRGVEYNASVSHRRELSISTTAGDGRTRGIARGDQINPYSVSGYVYLTTEPAALRRGGARPWSEPKVLLNAARRSRGPWCLAACSDREGLWAYQRITCVWPDEPKKWPPELIAAILNGPLANAWVNEREGKRDVRLATLRSLPLPSLARMDVSLVVALAREARRGLSPELVTRIDAEVLRGYALTPRAERKLLRSFEGAERPGVVGFGNYYPDDFDSALPLHKVLALVQDANRAASVSARTPAVDSPQVSAMFDRLMLDVGE